MSIVRFFMLVMLVSFISGCTKPTLVDQMQSRGISYLNTQKVVIRASEGGYGSDTVVNVEEEFIIQRIWDSIYVSRPYHRWSASGDEQVEFYSSREDSKPRLTLMVNVSDLARIKGQTYNEGFRCPGLNEYLQEWLKREYEKKHLK